MKGTPQTHQNVWMLRRGWGIETRDPDYKQRKLEKVGVADSGSEPGGMNSAPEPPSEEGGKQNTTKKERSFRKRKCNIE